MYKMNKFPTIIDMDNMEDIFDNLITEDELFDKIYINHPNNQVAERIRDALLVDNADANVEVVEWGEFKFRNYISKLTENDLFIGYVNAINLRVLSTTNASIIVASEGKSGIEFFRLSKRNIFGISYKFLY